MKEAGMASAQEFRRMALALEGTTEAPHFDRAAFRVARTFATLAADGQTANLKLGPDEQELKCLTVPEAFAPVPNKWGQQGWTTARLAALSPEQLAHALQLAWLHALPSPKRKRRPKPTRR
jgi:YjbR